MYSKKTLIKYASLFLAVFVLVSTTVFSFRGDVVLVGGVSTISVFSEKYNKSNVFESERVGNYAVLDNFKKERCSSLIFTDFDDLDFASQFLRVVSGRFTFYDGFAINYSSTVHRKVKLFLFYSFIKIPSVLRTL